MANFAFINSQNIVIGVNSINNSDITINNSENEQLGIDFLTNEIKIKTIYPNCVLIRQTSYNSNFRNKYAGLGDTWDEINNVFLPIANGGIDPQFFAFYIYNRWGELLFESHNKDYGWDGSYGNKLCESGVYIWKVEYKEKSLKKKQMSGHLNLIN